MSPNNKSISDAREVELKVTKPMVCFQTWTVSASKNWSSQMQSLQILNQHCSKDQQGIKNSFSPKNCVKATAFIVVLVELSKNWDVMRFIENHFTQMVGNFCTAYHRVLFVFIQCDTLVLQVCVFMNSNFSLGSLGKEIFPNCCQYSIP